MKYDPNQSTSGLTKKAGNLFIRLSNQYLKKSGIAHAYTPFLAQLWNEDGQTQAMLHRKVGIEQPTAVRTLDRMERDQLIERRRSDSDRREVRIFLTPKAQALKINVISCAQKINAVGTRGLSEKEQQTLHQLLKKVIENLESGLER